ncbi:MAG: PAS domain S-box protein [Promethearchaeota archaeon]
MAKKKKPLIRDIEDIYRLITEKINVLFEIINEKFILEYINVPACKRMLGYEGKEILRKSFLNLIHPDDITEDFKQIVKEDFRKENDLIQVRIRHKNGDYLWFELLLSIYSENRQEKKIIILGHDITPQKEIEQKLRESENRYRLITENANDLIAIINENYELEYTNEPILKKTLGYSQQEILFKEILQFIHPKDKKKAIEAFKKGIKKGENSVEVRFKHRDGHYIWLEIKGKLFKDQDGKYKGLIVSRDTTERKKELSTIQRNEALLRQFIDESVDGIVILNEEGKIIKWNKAQEQIFGYKSSEILEKPAWESFFLITPLRNWTAESKKEFESYVKKALKTGKGSWINKLLDYEMVDAHGNKKYIQQVIFPIKTEKGYLFGSICRDFTELKEIELKLKESETKYRDAYQQINFYKNLLAHDFSNIIGVIGGFTELNLSLLEDETHTEKLKINHLRIKEQVTRAKQLISNIQVLSKLEESPLELQPLDIYKYLLKSVKYIKNSFQDKPIVIDIETRKKKYIMRANELISHVFENLLINSIKYCNNPIVEILIKISQINKNGISKIQLEFIDNGIGIPDEQKSKLFQVSQPDMRTATIYESHMGIGLTLVKKIIDLYKGTITVEDKIKGDYSKGTKIIITLPKN